MRRSRREATATATAAATPASAANLTPAQVRKLQRQQLVIQQQQEQLDREEKERQRLEEEAAIRALPSYNTYTLPYQARLPHPTTTIPLQPNEIVGDEETFKGPMRGLDEINEQLYLPIFSLAPFEPPARFQSNLSRYPMPFVPLSSNGLGCDFMMNDSYWDDDLVDIDNEMNQAMNFFQNSFGHHHHQQYDPRAIFSSTDDPLTTLANLQQRRKADVSCDNEGSGQDTPIYQPVNSNPTTATSADSSLRHAPTVLMSDISSQKANNLPNQHLPQQLPHHKGAHSQQSQQSIHQPSSAVHSRPLPQSTSQYPNQTNSFAYTASKIPPVITTTSTIPSSAANQSTMNLNTSLAVTTNLTQTLLGSNITNNTLGLKGSIGSMSAMFNKNTSTNSNTIGLFQQSIGGMLNQRNQVASAQTMSVLSPPMGFSSGLLRPGTQPTTTTTTTTASTSTLPPTLPLQPPKPTYQSALNSQMATSPLPTQPQQQTPHHTSTTGFIPQGTNLGARSSLMRYMTNTTPTTALPPPQQPQQLQQAPRGLFGSQPNLAASPTGHVSSQLPPHTIPNNSSNPLGISPARIVTNNNPHHPSSPPTKPLFNTTAALGIQPQSINSMMSSPLNPPTTQLNPPQHHQQQHQSNLNATNPTSLTSLGHKSHLTSHTKLNALSTASPSAASSTFNPPAMTGPTFHAFPSGLSNLRPTNSTYGTLPTSILPHHGTAAPAVAAGLTSTTTNTTLNNLSTTPITSINNIQSSLVSRQVTQQPFGASLGNPLTNTTSISMKSAGLNHANQLNSFHSNIHPAIAHPLTHFNPLHQQQLQTALLGPNAGIGNLASMISPRAGGLIPGDVTQPQHPQPSTIGLAAAPTLRLNDPASPQSANNRPTDQPLTGTSKRLRNLKNQQPSNPDALKPPPEPKPFDPSASLKRLNTINDAIGDHSYDPENSDPMHQFVQTSAALMSTGESIPSEFPLLTSIDGHTQRPATDSISYSYFNTFPGDLHANIINTPPTIVVLPTLDGLLRGIDVAQQFILNSPQSLNQLLLDITYIHPLEKLSEDLHDGLSRMIEIENEVDRINEEIQHEEKQHQARLDAKKQKDASGMGIMPCNPLNLRLDTLKIPASSSLGATNPNTNLNLLPNPANVSVDFNTFGFTTNTTLGLNTTTSLPNKPVATTGKPLSVSNPNSYDNTTMSDLPPTPTQVEQRHLQPPDDKNTSNNTKNDIKDDKMIGDHSNSSTPDGSTQTTKAKPHRGYHRTVRPNYAKFTPNLVYPTHIPPRGLIDFDHLQAHQRLLYQRQQDAIKKPLRTWEDETGPVKSNEKKTWEQFLDAPKSTEKDINTTTRFDNLPPIHTYDSMVNYYRQLPRRQDSHATGAIFYHDSAYPVFYRDPQSVLSNTFLLRHAVKPEAYSLLHLYQFYHQYSHSTEFYLQKQNLINPAQPRSISQFTQQYSQLQTALDYYAISLNDHKQGLMNDFMLDSLAYINPVMNPGTSNDDLSRFNNGHYIDHIGNPIITNDQLHQLTALMSYQRDYLLENAPHLKKKNSKGNEKSESALKFYDLISKNKELESIFNALRSLTSPILPLEYPALTIPTSLFANYTPQFHNGLSLYNAEILTSMIPTSLGDADEPIEMTRDGAQSLVSHDNHQTQTKSLATFHTRLSLPTLNALLLLPHHHRTASLFSPPPRPLPRSLRYELYVKSLEAVFARLGHGQPLLHSSSFTIPHYFFTCIALQLFHPDPSYDATFERRRDGVVVGAIHEDKVASSLKSGKPIVTTKYTTRFIAPVLSLLQQETLFNCFTIYSLCEVLLFFSSLFPSVFTITDLAAMAPFALDSNHRMIQQLLGSLRGTDPSSFKAKFKPGGRRKQGNKKTVFFGANQHLSTALEEELLQQQREPKRHVTQNLNVSSLDRLANRSTSISLPAKIHNENGELIEVQQDLNNSPSTLMTDGKSNLGALKPSTSLHSSPNSYNISEASTMTRSDVESAMSSNDSFGAFDNSNNQVSLPQKDSPSNFPQDVAFAMDIAANETEIGAVLQHYLDSSQQLRTLEKTFAPNQFPYFKLEQHFDYDSPVQHYFLQVIQNLKLINLVFDFLKPRLIIPREIYTSTEDQDVERSSSSSSPSSSPSNIIPSFTSSYRQNDHTPNLTIPLSTSTTASPNKSKPPLTPDHHQYSNSSHWPVATPFYWSSLEQSLVRLYEILPPYFTKPLRRLKELLLVELYEPFLDNVHETIESTPPNDPSYPFQSTSCTEEFLNGLVLDFFQHIGTELLEIIKGLPETDEIHTILVKIYEPLVFNLFANLRPALASEHHVALLPASRKNNNAADTLNLSNQLSITINFDLHTTLMDMITRIDIFVDMMIFRYIALPMHVRDLFSTCLPSASLSYIAYALDMLYGTHNLSQHPRHLTTVFYPPQRHGQRIVQREPLLEYVLKELHGITLSTNVPNNSEVVIKSLERVRGVADATGGFTGKMPPAISDKPEFSSPEPAQHGLVSKPTEVFDENNPYALYNPLPGTTDPHNSLASPQQQQSGNNNDSPTSDDQSKPKVNGTYNGIENNPQFTARVDPHYDILSYSDLKTGIIGLSRVYYPPYRTHLPSLHIGHSNSSLHNPTSIPFSHLVINNVTSSSQYHLPHPTLSTFAMDTLPFGFDIDLDEITDNVVDSDLISAPATKKLTAPSAHHSADPSQSLDRYPSTNSSMNRQDFPGNEDFDNYEPTLTLNLDTPPVIVTHLNDFLDHTFAGKRDSKNPFKSTIHPYIHHVYELSQVSSSTTGVYVLWNDILIREAYHESLLYLRYLNASRYQQFMARNTGVNYDSILNKMYGLLQASTIDPMRLQITEVLNAAIIDALNSMINYYTTVYSYLSLTSHQWDRFAEMVSPLVRNTDLLFDPFDPLGNHQIDNKEYYIADHSHTLRVNGVRYDQGLGPSEYGAFSWDNPIKKRHDTNTSLDEIDTSSDVDSGEYDEDDDDEDDSDGENEDREFVDLNTPEDLLFTLKKVAEIQPATNIQKNSAVAPKVKPPGGTVQPAVAADVQPPPVLFPPCIEPLSLDDVFAKLTSTGHTHVFQSTINNNLFHTAQSRSHMATFYHCMVNIIEHNMSYNWHHDIVPSLSKNPATNPDVDTELVNGIGNDKTGRPANWESAQVQHQLDLMMPHISSYFDLNTKMVYTPIVSSLSTVLPQIYRAKSDFHSSLDPLVTSSIIQYENKWYTFEESFVPTNKGQWVDKLLKSNNIDLEAKTTTATLDNGDMNHGDQLTNDSTVPRQSVLDQSTTPKPARKLCLHDILNDPDSFKPHYDEPIQLESIKLQNEVNFIPNYHMFLSNQASRAALHVPYKTFSTLDPHLPLSGGSLTEEQRKIHAELVKTLPQNPNPSATNAPPQTKTTSKKSNASKADKLPKPTSLPEVFPLPYPPVVSAHQCLTTPTPPNPYQVTSTLNEQLYKDGVIEKPALDAMVPIRTTDGTTTIAKNLLIAQIVTNEPHSSSQVATGATSRMRLWLNHYDSGLQSFPGHTPWRDRLLAYTSSTISNHFKDFTLDSQYNYTTFLLQHWSRLINPKRSQIGSMKEIEGYFLMKNAKLSIPQPLPVPISTFSLLTQPKMMPMLDYLLESSKLSLPQMMLWDKRSLIVGNKAKWDEITFFGPTHASLTILNFLHFLTPYMRALFQATPHGAVATSVAASAILAANDGDGEDDMDDEIIATTTTTTTARSFNPSVYSAGHSTTPSSMLSGNNASMLMSSSAYSLHEPPFMGQFKKQPQFSNLPWDLNTSNHTNSALPPHIMPPALPNGGSFGGILHSNNNIPQVNPIKPSQTMATMKSPQPNPTLPQTGCINVNNNCNIGSTQTQVIDMNHHSNVESDFQKNYPHSHSEVVPFLLSEQEGYIVNSDAEDDLKTSGLLEQDQIPYFSAVEQRIRLVNASHDAINNNPSLMNSTADVNNAHIDEVESTSIVNSITPTDPIAQLFQTVTISNSLQLFQLLSLRQVMTQVWLLSLVVKHYQLTLYHQDVNAGIQVLFSSDPLTVVLFDTTTLGVIFASEQLGTSNGIGIDLNGDRVNGDEAFFGVIPNALEEDYLEDFNIARVIDSTELSPIDSSASSSITTTTKTKSKTTKEAGNENSMSKIHEKLTKNDDKRKKINETIRAKSNLDTQNLDIDKIYQDMLDSLAITMSNKIVQTYDIPTMIKQLKKVSNVSYQEPLYENYDKHYGKILSGGNNELITSLVLNHDNRRPANENTSMGDVDKKTTYTSASSTQTTIDNLSPDDLFVFRKFIDFKINSNQSKGGVQPQLFNQNVDYSQLLPLLTAMGQQLVHNKYTALLSYHMRQETRKSQRLLPGEPVKPPVDSILGPGFGSVPSYQIAVEDQRVEMVRLTTSLRAVLQDLHNFIDYHPHTLRHYHAFPSDLVGLLTTANDPVTCDNAWYDCPVCFKQPSFAHLGYLTTQQRFLQTFYNYTTPTTTQKYYPLHPAMTKQLYPMPVAHICNNMDKSPIDILTTLASPRVNQYEGDKIEQFVLDLYQKPLPAPYHALHLFPDKGNEENDYESIASKILNHAKQQEGWNPIDKHLIMEDDNASTEENHGTSMLNGTTVENEDDNQDQQEKEKPTPTQLCHDAIAILSRVSFTTHHANPFQPLDATLSPDSSTTLHPDHPSNMIQQTHLFIDPLSYFHPASLPPSIHADLVHNQVISPLHYTTFQPLEVTSETYQYVPLETILLIIHRELTSMFSHIPQRLDNPHSAFGNQYSEYIHPSRPDDDEDPIALGGGANKYWTPAQQWLNRLYLSHIDDHFLSHHILSTFSSNNVDVVVESCEDSSKAASSTSSVAPTSPATKTSTCVFPESKSEIANAFANHEKVQHLFYASTPSGFNDIVYKQPYLTFMPNSLFNDQTTNPYNTTRQTKAHTENSLNKDITDSIKSSTCQCEQDYNVTFPMHKDDLGHMTTSTTDLGYLELMESTANLATQIPNCRFNNNPTQQEEQQQPPQQGCPNNNIDNNNVHQLPNTVKSINSTSGSRAIQVLDANVKAIHKKVFNQKNITCVQVDPAQALDLTPIHSKCHKCSLPRINPNHQPPQPAIYPLTLAHVPVRRPNIALKSHLPHAKPAFMNSAATTRAMISDDGHDGDHVESTASTNSSFGRNKNTDNTSSDFSSLQALFDNPSSAFYSTLWYDFASQDPNKEPQSQELPPTPVAPSTLGPLEIPSTYAVLSHEVLSMGSLAATSILNGTQWSSQQLDNLEQFSKLVIDQVAFPLDPQ